MAGLTNIHVSDFGYEIRLRIVQDGVAVDISSYTTRQYIFTAPDGTQTTKTATFADTGLDGELSYTAEEGFITVAGTWGVRARLAKTGAELTSELVRFYAAARE